ncbi:helix-turn-helix domain-containing protein, partial [Tolypothrix sp. VBCCA 56010]|uniref:helix-turn-helix domain-containing protein n=1 Tax=Tolypothrix sp. VBCCA 56010 TaxID=3137731 RepID=UPI003D7D2836
LWDQPREGAPVKFSAEQVTQIIAIACEKPEASGYPISHWSGEELADAAIKRGVVESISAGSVQRFLKRNRFKTSS